jgi:hypothetical protein
MHPQPSRAGPSGPRKVNGKRRSVLALDVYGLTKRRDLEKVDRFLDEYVDRASSAERGDEDLLMEPLGIEPEGMRANEQWEYVPSRTLSHIVELGLAHPRRAFVAYLKSLPARREAGIEQVMLGFTRDDQLILGMAVYTGDETDEVLARDLLAHLSEVYGCHVGLILLHQPPPLSEAEFRHPADGLRVVLHATFDA